MYRGLETLTAVPTAAERQHLEHRLVACVPVTETFSVGEFMPLAHGEIDAALAAGQRPLVVGGTGLYLRAALTELDLRPPPGPGVRERIEREVGARGVPALHATLAERAPAAAERIRPTDRTRVTRALELLEVGEDPLDPATARGEESQLWTEAMRRPTLLVGLTLDRAALYERIDRRVDAMVAAGAVEEVRAANAAGASRTARKALGFDDLLRGDVEGLKRRTRHLAKRQLTWMRKLGGVQVVDTTDRSPAEVAEIVAARL